jgi:hypothetical protein
MHIIDRVTSEVRVVDLPVFQTWHAIYIYFYFYVDAGRKYVARGMFNRLWITPHLNLRIIINCFDTSDGWLVVDLPLHTSPAMFKIMTIRRRRAGPTAFDYNYCSLVRVRMACRENLGRTCQGGAAGRPCAQCG